MSVISQLSSAQNNPYVKVAHVGVAYSDPLLGEISGGGSSISVGRRA